MERIYGHEMTTTSGGNISVRDENGDVWITPARVDKGNLCRQDIVRIGANGEKEGSHPPSSESPFHLSVYKVRPDLHAVIHAHPGALVSFSICGQVPAHGFSRKPGTFADLWPSRLTRSLGASSSGAAFLINALL